MWQKQIRAEEAARSALTVPSRTLIPQIGFISDEVFDNDSSGTANGSPSGIAAGALVLAARGPWGR